MKRGPVKVKFSNFQFRNIEVEFSLTIDALKITITSSQSIIENLWKELDNDLNNDEVLNSLHKDHQVSYQSQFYQKREYLIEEIKSTSRNSMLITLFSLFESTLKKVKIECEDKFEIKSKKIKNSIIPNLWKFFKEEIEIVTNESFENLFNKISSQLITRNSIVHNLGIVENEKKVEIIKETKGLNFVKSFPSHEDSEIRIVIEDDIYLHELIDNMESFIEKLLIQIDSKCEYRLPK